MNDGFILFHPRRDKQIAYKRRRSAVLRQRKFKRGMRGFAAEKVAVIDVGFFVSHVRHDDFEPRFVNITVLGFQNGSQRLPA